MATTKSNNNSENINAYNTQVNNNSMDPRDAVIIALCAKLGVDATAIMAGVKSENGKCEKPTKVKVVPICKKHQDAIDELNSLSETALSVEDVKVRNNGYSSDVVVGLTGKNALTSALVNELGCSPIRNLYVGGLRKDGAERIEGIDVNRRWSGAVIALIDSLKQAKKKDYDTVITTYLNDHQELIMAIREWKTIAWDKTKRAKIRKSALKAIFKAYESPLANSFAA